MSRANASNAAEVKQPYQLTIRYKDRGDDRLKYATVSYANPLTKREVEDDVPRISLGLQNQGKTILGHRITIICNLTQ